MRAACVALTLGTFVIAVSFIVGAKNMQREIAIANNHAAQRDLCGIYFRWADDTREHVEGMEKQCAGFRP